MYKEGNAIVQDARNNNTQDTSRSHGSIRKEKKTRLDRAILSLFSLKPTPDRTKDHKGSHPGLK